MRSVFSSFLLPNRSNFTVLLAFAAPAGVLILSRIVAVQPPALMAQSDPGSEPPAVIRIEPPPPTPQQIAAKRRSAEIASALMDTSPLYYAKHPEPVVEEPQVAPPTPAPKPTTVPTPALSLTSIIRSADEQVMALVNGKIHRVGDSVGGGWTITAIDPKARCLTISHERAEPVVITLVEPKRN